MNIFQRVQEQEQERRAALKSEIIASVVAETNAVILALRSMSKEEKSAYLACIERACER